MYNNSGPIRLVIDVDMDEDEDMSSVVAMVASTERRGQDQLCDADWFREDVSQCGLDYLLGLKDWDDLKPGLWVIEGYLWGDHIYSVNGDDYDGGFEVENAEPLTDVAALARDWLDHEGDAAMVQSIISELQLGMEVRHPAVHVLARERIDALGEILLVLRDLVGRQEDLADDQKAGE